MDMEKLSILSLIGGILILFGSFLPWTTVGEIVTSGWNSFDVLMISSGILILIGIIPLLGLQSKALAPLIPTGGVLALINSIQVYRASTGMPTLSKGVFSWEYGIFICLTGAILTLIGSIATVKEE